jgi:hypothetical protein
VPHLHLAAWFEDPRTPEHLLHPWLALAEPYGASRLSQHAAPIHDALGWAKYLAKHAARGIGHYQRNPANIPAEWHTRTGRVWGHVGTFPTVEATDEELTDATYYRARRILLAHQAAQVRAQGNHAHARSIRRRLQMPEPASRTHALAGWLPAVDQARLLDHLDTFDPPASSAGVSVERAR